MKIGKALTSYQKSIIKSTYEHELDDIHSKCEVINMLKKSGKNNPHTTPLYSQMFFDPKKSNSPKIKTNEELNIVSKGKVREYIIETLQETLIQKNKLALSDNEKEKLLNQFRDNDRLLRRGNVQRLNEMNNNFTTQWRERIESAQERFSGTIDRIDRFNRRFDKWNERMAEFRKNFSCSKQQEDESNHISR